MQVKCVISIPFDIPRGDGKLTKEWIVERLDIFNNFTLQSFNNQTDKDFEVWLRCNPENKNLTQNYPFDGNVKVIYDRAKSELEKINTEYLMISRMDSDDLYHKDAIKLMKEKAVFFGDNRRTFMAFRKCYDWDRVNGFIHTYYVTAPPFTTQILPRIYYKDWNLFCKSFYRRHGALGGKAKNVVVLPDYKVCVHRNNLRCGYLFRGKKPPKYSKEWMKEKFEQGRILAYTKEDKIKILSDFGVDEKWIS